MAIPPPLMVIFYNLASCVAIDCNMRGGGNYTNSSQTALPLWLAAILCPVTELSFEGSRGWIWMIHCFFHQGKNTFKSCADITKSHIHPSLHVSRKDFDDGGWSPRLVVLSFSARSLFVVESQFCNNVYFDPLIKGYKSSNTIRVHP